MWALASSALRPRLRSGSSIGASCKSAHRSSDPRSGKSSSYSLTSPRPGRSPPRAATPPTPAPAQRPPPCARTTPPQRRAPVECSASGLRGCPRVDGLQFAVSVQRELFNVRTPADALSILFEHLPEGLSLRHESLATRDALDRILAQDVVSLGPARLRALGDGWLRRARRRHFRASEGMPACLTISDDIPMGRAPGEAIHTGNCARISTGGMLPPGADAVIMVEQTQEAKLPPSRSCARWREADAPSDRRGTPRSASRSQPGDGVPRPRAAASAALGGESGTAMRGGGSSPR